MRTLLVVVALALSCFAGMAAGKVGMGPAPAPGADVTSVSTLVRTGDAIQVDAASPSGQVPVESAQAAADSGADDDRDTVGSEREAPDAIPVFGAPRLAAPHASRVRHRSVDAEAAVTRAIRPVVQPPRG